MKGDTISRQAAIDEVINLWADKPFGNPALVEIKDCIEKLPSVEAIPVEWITSKIARFRAMDNAFASLTASQIMALLNDWRTEQNEG